MARAHQDAPLLRPQRKKMPRLHKILCRGPFVSKKLYGPGAVMRGNAGSNAFPGVYRNSPGGLIGVLRIPAHQMQPQPLGDLIRHGDTNKAPAVFSHEVDLFGGYLCGRNYKVPLVLPGRVIDHNDHLASAYIVDDFAYRVELHCSCLQTTSLRIRDKGKRIKYRSFASLRMTRGVNPILRTTLLYPLSFLLYPYYAI